MHIPSAAMKVRAGLKAFVEHFKFDRKNSCNSQRNLLKHYRFLLKFKKILKLMYEATTVLYEAMKLKKI